MTNVRTPIMIFVIGVFACAACSRSKDASGVDAGNASSVSAAESTNAKPPIRRHRPHQPREVPDDSFGPHITPDAGL